MGPVLASLLGSSCFTLFLVITLNFVLKEVGVGKLSLSISTIVFVTLLFKRFNMVVPGRLNGFKLMLFVFAVNVRTNPKFFSSFQDGKGALVLVAVLVVYSTSLATMKLGCTFSVSAPDIMKLVTNTLADAPKLTMTVSDAGSPVTSVTCNVTCPFNIVKIVLFIGLLPGVVQIGLSRRTHHLRVRHHKRFPRLNAYVCHIAGPDIFNHDLVRVGTHTVAKTIVSQLGRSRRVSVPATRAILHRKSCVRTIKDSRSLGRLTILVNGHRRNRLPLSGARRVRSLLLAGGSVVGGRLNSLGLRHGFNYAIAHIHQDNVSLSPSPSLTLGFNSGLVIMNRGRNVRKITHLLNGSTGGLSSASFFPVTVKVMLNMLFKGLGVSFPNKLSFSPKLANNMLVITLILDTMNGAKPVL